MKSFQVLPLIAGTMVLVLLLSCGEKSNPTTAPPPPDNPNPPLLEFVPSFQPASQTLSFIPPEEDLHIEMVTVGFQHSGLGGINVRTDFVPALVAYGDTLTVRVTTDWSWQSTDFFTLGVRVRRPGQTLAFGLCCLGCSHTGGTLKNAPCSR